MGKLGYLYFKGRSNEAPQLHCLSQSLDEYLYGQDASNCEWVQLLLDCVRVQKYKQGNNHHHERLNSITDHHKAASTGNKQCKHFHCRDIGEKDLTSIGDQAEHSMTINAQSGCRPDGCVQSSKASSWQKGDHSYQIGKHWRWMYESKSFHKGSPILVSPARRQSGELYRMFRLNGPELQ